MMAYGDMSGRGLVTSQPSYVMSSPLCVAAQGFPCDLHPVEPLGSQTELWGTQS